LWLPYVDQADVDAQFHLAEFYLDHYDEGPEKETEMKKLLRLAADRGWRRTRSRVFWQVTRSAATLRTQPIFQPEQTKPEGVSGAYYLHGLSTPIKHLLSLLPGPNSNLSPIL
jgi:hypothetical protein